jgi:Ni,Fe-hydrogenase I cytochrome b subunit
MAHCWLNVVALILSMFRSDAERIANDFSHLVRLNKWYFILGLVILLFTMFPLTIPFTIKHIFNRLKGDK